MVALRKWLKGSSINSKDLSIAWFFNKNKFGNTISLSLLLRNVDTLP